MLLFWFEALPPRLQIDWQSLGAHSLLILSQVLLLRLCNNIGGRSYSVRCWRYVGCVLRSEVNGMKDGNGMGRRSEVGRSRVGTTSDATEEDLASASGAAPSLQ